MSLFAYLKRLFISFIAYKICAKYFEIQFHFGLNGQLLDHSIKYRCSIIFASVSPLNDAAANNNH